MQEERDEFKDDWLNIKKPVRSGFENKTVPHSQPFQMAENSQSKKKFQRKKFNLGGYLKIHC